jgi:1-acyl-sn-glycerol-3-phosphate acyltransferase
VVLVALGSAYGAALPAGRRGIGLLLPLAAVGVGTGAALVAGPAVAAWPGAAGIAAVGAALAWVVWRRATAEQLVETLLWPMYRVRAVGPGFARFPRRGPALVYANHAAWLDPFWLATVLPRPVTPLMTSLFFDKPGVRWLMTHVIPAIRLSASHYRRAAPELNEAVAALDRGECLLIFPEGWLRRRDDVLLRRFSRGIVLILRQRPATPVVPCWVEGGWGSYTSFAGGPPTAHKRPDWRRRVEVVVAEPRTLDPDALADLRTARGRLMADCLELRRHVVPG